jgi:uncharacterized protein GlcG (DUF336 family)
MSLQRSCLSRKREGASYGHTEHHKARNVFTAAEKKANEIGQPMNIAVVDDGEILISHISMDGSSIGSINISITKAFTPHAFDIVTKDLTKHSQPRGQFYGIHASNETLHGMPCMV